MLGAKELAKYIDHTLLSPVATSQQIRALCEEAKKWEFFSVCVQPYYLELCAELLKGSPVKLCTVVGFPLGQNSTETKVFETEEAVRLGASEIDMVINVAALKEGNQDYVANEITKVLHATQGHLLKVIIETCLLSEQEISLATSLCEKAGAHFVKTSTGFSTSGAKLADIQIIKNARTTPIKIKASGGIRDLDSALKFIEAGVDRIGTSKSVEIMESLNHVL